MPESKLKKRAVKPHVPIKFTISSDRGRGYNTEYKTKSTFIDHMSNNYNTHTKKAKDSEPEDQRLLLLTHIPIFQYAFVLPCLVYKA